jgi:hypothetical protein
MSLSAKYFLGHGGITATRSCNIVGGNAAPFAIRIAESRVRERFAMQESCALMSQMGYCD